MLFNNDFSDEVEEMFSEYREENSEWVEENLEKTMDLMMLGFLAGADHVRMQISGVDETVDQFTEEVEERLE